MANQEEFNLFTRKKCLNRADIKNLCSRLMKNVDSEVQDFAVVHDETFTLISKDWLTSATCI